MSVILFELPDRYGTSVRRLAVTGLVSWLGGVMVFLLFIGLAENPNEVSVIVKNHHQTPTRRPQTKRLGAFGTALAASFVSLFLFAEKLLNVEGLVGRFVGGQMVFKGKSRWVSGILGLWGLYLAVRALALAAGVQV